MTQKIGFVGCGNMGSSMVGGLIKSGFVKPEHVIVSTKTEASLKRLSNEFNVITTLNIKDVVKKSDIIVLAVKPNIYKSIIKEIESELTEDKLIITIAAGITIENMEEWLGEGRCAFKGGETGRRAFSVFQWLLRVCPSVQISLAPGPKPTGTVTS